MRASGRPSAALPDRWFAMLLDAVPHVRWPARNLNLYKERLKSSRSGVQMVLKLIKCCSPCGSVGFAACSPFDIVNMSILGSEAWVPQEKHHKWCFRDIEAILCNANADAKQMQIQKTLSWDLKRLARQKRWAGYNSSRAFRRAWGVGRFAVGQGMYLAPVGLTAKCWSSWADQHWSTADNMRIVEPHWTRHKHRPAQGRAAWCPPQGGAGG